MNLLNGFIQGTIDELTVDYLTKSINPNLVDKQVWVHSSTRGNFLKTVNVNPDKDNKKGIAPQKAIPKEKAPFRKSLDNMFLNVQTSKGAKISSIAYEHIEEHKVERNTESMDVMKSALNILKKPIKTSPGTSKDGTTMYWGSHIVDGKDVGMIVVVKDFFDSKSQKGVLLTIITPFQADRMRLYNELKETGKFPANWYHKQVSKYDELKKLKGGLQHE